MCISCAERMERVLPYLGILPELVAAVMIYIYSWSV